MMRLASPASSAYRVGLRGFAKERGHCTPTSSFETTFLERKVHFGHHPRTTPIADELPIPPKLGRGGTRLEASTLFQKPLLSPAEAQESADRKSTRLNSSHVA